jgi:hypothetical protein
MKLRGGHGTRLAVARRSCGMTLAGLLLAVGLSACWPLPGPQSPPCSGRTQDYHGTCVPHATAEYLTCIQDRGFSPSTDVSAGVPLPKVAGATLQVAYKTSKEEDSIVALQIVRDCLTLAEHAATSGTDRGGARQYARQATRDIGVVQQGLPAIDVAPPETLDCGTAGIGAQVPCQATIKSTGVTALNITGTEVTGTNGGDFTASAGCPPGTRLGPGQDCTLTIQFQPSAPGERDAVLIIHQNLPPPDRGTMLPLTGTGTAGPASPGGHLLTVTVDAPAATGVVSSNPPGIAGCRSTCAHSFDDGTDITLSAAPDQGSSQIIWDGCDTASGDTCTIHLTADRAVTARLSPIASPVTPPAPT